MKIQEKLNYSYFAGLLDGEGHFCIANCTNGRGEKYKQARIILSNTDKKMVDWIYKTYGGHITTYKAKPERNAKEYYRWEIVGKKAITLTLFIRPFLITKQEQSACIFNLWQIPNETFKHSDQYIEKHKQIQRFT